MSEELVKLKKPKLPLRWDYDESVGRVKGFIYKWRDLTIEIAQELWIAREKLRAQGKRTDLETKVSKSPTWTQYCEDIGSSKEVVNRWLHRWFEPELMASLLEKARKCAERIIAIEEECEGKGDVYWLKRYFEEIRELGLQGQNALAEYNIRLEREAGFDLYHLRVEKQEKILSQEMNK